MKKGRGSWIYSACRGLWGDLAGAVGAPSLELLKAGSCGPWAARGGGGAASPWQGPGRWAVRFLPTQLLCDSVFLPPQV